MSKVPAELVDLLQALFDQGELSRALERQDWSVELVKHLRPAGHATPDAWFHGVVRLAVQRDEVPELMAVVRRLRPKRTAEIEAVGRLFAEREAAAPTPAVKVAAGAAASATAASDGYGAPTVKVAPAPPAGEGRRAPAVKAGSAAETPPSPPAWRPVRVLHPSDLHFSAKTAWDATTVLGRLASDVASLRGDVAADEYAQTTAWLTGPLATATGVTPAQIRVVPGNHDVRRVSITHTARMVADGLLRDPEPQPAVAEVLSSETERAPLLARQAAYLTFAQTFHPGLTVPWWSARLPDLQGLTVHLAGFNSAWLSASDNDRGNLLLSRWQCKQLLAGSDGLTPRHRERLRAKT